MRLSEEQQRMSTVPYRHKSPSMRASQIVTECVKSSISRMFHNNFQLFVNKWVYPNETKFLNLGFLFVELFNSLKKIANSQSSSCIQFSVSRHHSANISLHISSVLSHI